MALLLLPSLAATQMMQAIASANAGLLRPGETFEFTVRVTQWTQEGAAGPRAEVEWPDWEKVGLTPAQGRRRHTSSRSGPGATMSVTVEAITLQAGKAGTVTIPPVTVRAGNDSATTNQVILVVDARAPVAAPSPPSPPTAPTPPVPPPPAMPSPAPANPASPGSPPWWQGPTLTTPPPMSAQPQPSAREDRVGDLQMKVGAAAFAVFLIALVVAMDRARRRRAAAEEADPVAGGPRVAGALRPERGAGLDPAATLRKLEQLRARDRHLSVSGAATHRYRLNPPLTESRVAAFEAKWKVRLPDDYRLFLTQVGNGGAGPYYGLERLGEIEGEPWREQGEGQMVGDLTVPFRHQLAWNLPQSFWDDKPDWGVERDPDEEARLQEQWDTKLDAQYWEPHIMDGAIPICHAGCGQFRWLVVSGEHRGRIWADHRVDEEGIWPLVDGTGEALTFSAWYHAWLDDALYGPLGADDPRLRRPFRG